MLPLPKHRPPHELEEIEWHVQTLPAEVDVAAALAPCTRLTSIQFYYTNPSVHFLEQLMTLTRIKRLSFTYFPNFRFLDAICAQGAHLTHLELVGELQQKHMFANGTVLTNLESLKIPQPGTTTLVPGLVAFLRRLPRLTLLGVCDIVVTEELLDTLVCSTPRLRTLKADASGPSSDIPVQAFSRVLQVLPLTSLDLSLRHIAAPHLKALGACTTLQYLNLFACRFNLASAALLASSVSLTWLDVGGNGKLGEVSELRRLTALTGIHLPDNTPLEVANDITQRVEAHKEQMAYWRRRDLLTSILLLASQRLVAGSVWAKLPLDVVRHIFSYVTHRSKRPAQIAGAVECVFANAGEIWARVRAEKRGVILWERVAAGRSEFWWQVPASAASAPPLKSQEERRNGDEEKCCVQ